MVSGRSLWIVYPWVIRLRGIHFISSTSALPQFITLPEDASLRPSLDLFKFSSLKLQHPSKREHLWDTRFAFTTSALLNSENLLRGYIPGHSLDLIDFSPIKQQYPCKRLHLRDTHLIFSIAARLNCNTLPRGVITRILTLFPQFRLRGCGPRSPTWPCKRWRWRTRCCTFARCQCGVRTPHHSSRAGWPVLGRWR